SHNECDTQEFKVLSVKLQCCDIPYHESQDFKFFSAIGSGRSASVYAAYWKSTQTKFAIKKFAEGSTKEVILNEFRSIVLGITSCSSPFKFETANKTVSQQAILNGEREISISTTNSAFVKLYQKCWEHEPDLRPDIGQVISELNSIDSKSHCNTIENYESEITVEDDFSGCDADEEGHQKQLDKTIKKCNMDIFNYIGESTDTDDISHKLVHIYTNFPLTDEEVIKDENEMDLDTSSRDILLDRDGKEPYTKEIIRFSSDYVKKEVTEKLEENIRNKLRTETYLSLESGISNSLLSISFEQIAHWVLRDGGSFKTRSLGFNGVEENFTIHRQSETLDFLKMTIVNNHPIKMIGLRGESASDDFKFYFVILGHLYDNYKKQDFHTSDDTLAQNTPLWIRFRVNQYALKIDL
ncbi:912_t:CDS:2, partial [Funneliformis caledonium]